MENPGQVMASREGEAGSLEKFRKPHKRSDSGTNAAVFGTRLKVLDRFGEEYLAESSKNYENFVDIYRPVCIVWV